MEEKGGSHLGVCQPYGIGYINPYGIELMSLSPILWKKYGSLDPSTYVFFL